MWKSIKDYFRAFKVLVECPREVFIMYGLTLFDSLAYFTMSYVLIKYLTDNYGFSDVDAGWIYGAWTMVISVVIFFVGAFTDSIGIKKALLTGIVLLVISRSLMAFVPTLPDNQFEFSRDHVVHHYNVSSYTRKVPKGQEQPEPFPFPETRWDIAADPGGAGVIVTDHENHRYLGEVATGHRLNCTDMTVYTQAEEASRPEMLQQLVFVSDDGSRRGTVSFTGTLATRDGETRTAWETASSQGQWNIHPQQQGAPLDLTAPGWVLGRSPHAASVDVGEIGFFQGLANLVGAIRAGRQERDLSDMALKDLSLTDPDGRTYHVNLRCIPLTPPQGILAQKLRMQGADHQYSEIRFASGDGLRKGVITYQGIITDVQGHDVTMWKVNTAEMRWEAHPTLAGTYRPSNMPQGSPELKKLFFFSKGNSSAMWALVVGLFILAFGTALMSPVILTAKKYYTNSRTRTTVFMGYYLVVNIAAMLSGFVVDKLRIPYGNQSIFVFGFFMVFLSYLLVQFFLREGVDEEEKERLEKVKQKVAEGQEVDPEELKDRRQKDAADLHIWSVVKDIGMKLYTVARESNFWRYVLFLVIILGVRLIFTHWFMVMPKYYTRVVGEGVPIGTLNAINPLLIAIGLIVATPLINKIKIYPCFILGTTISAASMLVLMVPGSAFGFLGLDTWQGYFLIIVMQIMIFSVGEVIWSPRTAEYAANIAPRGRVGTYMSLASLMLFVSKPLNGLLSGWLLRDYCPEGTYERIYYARDLTYWEGPEVMWVIYGAIAVVSPLGLVLLRRVIQAKDTDADGKKRTAAA